MCDEKDKNYSRVHMLVSSDKNAFVEQGAVAVLPAFVGRKQCQPSHNAGHGYSSATNTNF